MDNMMYQRCDELFNIIKKYLNNSNPLEETSTKSYFYNDFQENFRRNPIAFENELDKYDMVHVRGGACIEKISRYRLDEEYYEIQLKKTNIDDLGVSVLLYVNNDITGTSIEELNQGDAITFMFVPERIEVGSYRVTIPCLDLYKVSSYDNTFLLPAELKTGGYAYFIIDKSIFEIVQKMREREEKKQNTEVQKGNEGCYIATCVYGSYDCPSVWTLRRFRDNILAQNICGRTFIKLYYAISPSLVKWFGNKKWFRLFWKKNLDNLVDFLHKQGVDDKMYFD